MSYHSAHPPSGTRGGGYSHSVPLPTEAYGRRKAADSRSGDEDVERGHSAVEDLLLSGR